MLLIRKIIIIVCLVSLGSTHAIANTKGQTEYVNGAVLWGNSASNTIQIGNLLWQDAPNNSKAGKYWKEAKSYCADLHIDNNTGQISGFRLPTKEEMNELYQYKELLKYSANEKYYTSSSWRFFRRGGVYIINFDNGEENSIEESNQKDYYYRCVKKSDFDNIGIIELAKKIQHSKLGNYQNLDLPEKPVKPKLVTSKELKKGEFETTSDFERRLRDEKLSIEKVNKISSSKYKGKISKWTSKVTQLKLEHAEKLKNFDQKSMYWDSYTEAIYEIYGNPSIKSAKYNADNQTFEVRITSSRAQLREFDELLKESKNIIKEPKNSSDGYITIIGVYDLGNSSALKIKINKDLKSLDIGDFEVDGMHARYAIYKGKRYTEGKPKLYFKSNDEVFIVVGKITKPIFDTPDEFGPCPDSSIKGIQIDIKHPLSNIDTLSYLFDETTELAVPISKAREVKKVISSPEFQPIIELSIRNNELHLAGVKNLGTFDSLLNEKKYFDNAVNSIEKLNRFVITYPSSSLIVKAKSRIAFLEKEEVQRKQDAKDKVVKEENERKEKLARLKYESKFLSLGSCKIGNSVIHREKWNTKTSSGNVVADFVFNAATKEEFIIEFEGVVEGFTGDKVRAIINDYRIKQTIGGGVLQPKTYRKYDIGKYADKYLGKTQFYPRSRCQ